MKKPLTHLYFCDKLTENGYAKTKSGAVFNYTGVLGNQSHDIYVEAGKAKCQTLRYDNDAQEELIRHLINLDSWKHSWHYDVQDVNNYETFLAILQEKAIDRAKELSLLMEGIFMLNRLVEENRKKVEQENIKNFGF